MNDELIDVAQEAQRRHAELIAEASRRTSIEARVEVRNDLDALRMEFTQRALSLTGVQAPYLWVPENPDHAVALAVRRDIADTEEQLSRLANGEAFQKILKADAQFGYSVFGGGGGGNDGPGPKMALGALAALLIVVVILAWRD